MRKDGKYNLEDYELFYVEIPQPVHSELEDVIITDSESQESPEADLSGLSTEQVKQIARDSMESHQSRVQDQDDQDQLFRQ